MFAVYNGFLQISSITRRSILQEHAIQNEMCKGNDQDWCEQVLCKTKQNCFTFVLANSILQTFLTNPFVLRLGSPMFTENMWKYGQHLRLVYLVLLFWLCICGCQKLEIHLEVCCCIGPLSTSQYRATWHDLTRDGRNMLKHPGDLEISESRDIPYCPY